MSRTELAKNETIGLDVGTSRIVTARQINNEIKYNTQLNAFITIPYSKMTENVLQKEAVPHSVEGTDSGARQRIGAVCGPAEQGHPPDHVARRTQSG